jgi:hypothetical protein
LIWVLAISFAPLAAWGILGAVAQFWKISLRATLPWLHASRLALSLISMALIVTALASHNYFWFFPIGLSLTSASLFFGTVEAWIKRRYVRELLALQSDSWWPTIRT